MTHFIKHVPNGLYIQAKVAKQQQQQQHQIRIRLQKSFSLARTQPGKKVSPFMDQTKF